MNVDPRLQFQHLCAQKYLRGIWEYRDGDASRPFVGDLWQEYSEEQLDSVNYLFDKFQEGKISREEYEYAFSHHFELWWWAQGRRHGNGA